MNERKISALPRSQVLALAREILLPEAVIADLSAALPAEIPDSLCLPLTRPEQAFSHWKELVSQPAFCDERGIHLLGIYLTAACHTRKLYQSIGIPDSIFLDTMGCFSRFLQEAQARSGRFHFDRGFWAWRHLCCRLFRLGTLEFEYRTVGTAPSLPAQLQPDSPVLFVHIPSNARLFQPTLSDSYQKAALFFAKYAPALCTSGPPQAILCCSWLLSPALHSLLPSGSHILTFSRDYRIFTADPDNDSFYLRLFNGQKSADKLPQQTTLQRKAAAFVASGGKIGTGFGILENPAISPSF